MLRHASIKDLDGVYNLFRKNRKLFPHIRKSYLEERILQNECIYEDGVVITYKIYKVPTNIGYNTRTNKSDCILKQIVSTNRDGSASTLLNRFFDYVNGLPNCSGRVFLSVRNENKIAKRFYEKNGMELIDHTSWSDGKIAGDIYIGGNKSDYDFGI